MASPPKPSPAKEQPAKSPAKPAAASPTKSPEKAKEAIKPETQEQQPGMEWKMDMKPITIRETYRGSGKLDGRVALITGGDSGIGRAVAVHFAREGADVAIAYLPEEEHDAKETEALVAKEGRKCLRVAGDVGSQDFCRAAVDKVAAELGGLHVLVNNASQQHYREDISEVTQEELASVFKTNVNGYFFMAQAALKHMKAGAAIINLTSVVAYRGSPELLTYSASKGAEVSMTRALASLCAPKGIRVNAVAPGPIWTPLIPATFSKEKIEAWKSSVPMDRPGQPAEVAPSYVFLASEDASFFVGQTLHPDGGVPLAT